MEHKIRAGESACPTTKHLQALMGQAFSLAGLHIPGHANHDSGVMPITIPG